MAALYLLITFFSLAIIVVLAQHVLEYLGSPLRKLPGPFLAKFTHLWRFKDNYNQTQIETQLRLHAQHGDVVQIGPNVVSVADPSLIKVIYSTRGTFRKSEFYSVNDAMQPDGTMVQNIFGTRSNEFHSKQIKPIQKLYSLQASQKLEPMMNDTIQILCSELEQRFMTGENKRKTCDIADWISFFAWDFLGDMTLSKRFGFMEAGTDIHGMLKTAEDAIRYFAVVGQMPILDNWLAKNRYLPWKFPAFSAAASFCVERFSERMQKLEAMKDKKDFMNGFLQAQRDDPSVTSHDIIGWLLINILGGADTTAIVTKAIFYYILKNPAVKSALVSELRSANLVYPPTYASLESLPYLSACVKEGLRIHPVTGQILERIVQATGLTIPFPTATSSTSVTLPPGTIVGMNSWIIHRREEIFGPSVEEFVPERWLRGASEPEEVFDERVRKMKEADLSFGNGNRTCLGRPLATVELYKVTATLFGKYEQIELEDPMQEWELHKQFFVWPHKVRVKMSPY
ncbi:cytochrome P450 [Byssothecium circinans]|uniref:Cytochrome P450 n=1 Tax=Byssothecium circinans TaxID=147558 RepID=A0A6A5TQU7_9PLEO|nr:cytochrome P450 [Byssothecium circinans]